MRSAVRAAVLDACCVLLFVMIGRASHSKSETLAGVASTLWPFLGALAAGWLAAHVWRRPAAILSSGAGAWLGTTERPTRMRRDKPQVDGTVLICRYSVYKTAALAAEL